MTRRIRYLPLLLLTTGTLVLVAALVNWVVDPFRYYHAPWLEIGYSDRQRYQNPGLARTANYEIVLIGTSHTEHFPPSQISSALGGKALNLSMAGALIEEQQLLARRVLARGKARRIVWEINYASFSYGEGVSNAAAFPFFLYQPGPETPFRYLVSWDTFEESLAALGGTRPASMDELHRWDREATFNKTKVLEHWQFISNRWNDARREHYAHYAVEEREIPALIDRYLAPLVEQHPEVEFDFLLLPSTLLDFSSDFLLHPDRPVKRMRLRDELARLSGQFPNASIWDFQLDDRVTRDFSSYKDIDHFGPEVVSFVLDSLATREHLATGAQVIRNTEALSRRVVTFTRAFCAEAPNRCQNVMLSHLKAIEARIQANNFHPGDPE